MTVLRFTVPGKASTRHRGKRRGRGQHHAYKDTGYEAWKVRVAYEARRVRGPLSDWPMHAIGPRGGKRPLLYAVSIVGYATDGGYDADNLRGILDACEGTLWRNDRSCKPVVYDCLSSAEVDEVRVEVTPWDPRDGRMLGRFEWRGSE